jgi:hypothetical protein
MTFDSFTRDITIYSQSLNDSRWTYLNSLTWRGKVILRAYSLRPMTFDDFMKFRSDVVYKWWASKVLE